MTQSILPKYAIALLVSAFMTIGISSCSKNDDDTTVTTTTAANGVISANHGHIAIISPAQLNAGSSLSLEFTGTATHTHTISLTAAEVTSIRTGGSVSKESTITSGHSHTVKFN